MHHLKHRSENGATTVENGANVSEISHQYLHSLPRDQEEIINDMLRQWKRDFRIGVVEITTQGIQQAEVIEFEEPEEVIIIPAYDIDPKEYEKYLQERRRRELEKPKWRGER